MLKKKDGDDQRALVEVPPAKLLGETPDEALDRKSSDSGARGNQRTARRDTGANGASNESIAATAKPGNEPKHTNKSTKVAATNTVQEARRSNRKASDPIDEALEAANYGSASLEDTISGAQSTYVAKPISKQQRSLLQEQDRREQYLAYYLDGEINLSWRIAVIVLLVFIGLAAAKSWADAFMTLSIFMVGYLLHAVIMVVRLKRDADA